MHDSKVTFRVSPRLHGGAEKKGGAGMGDEGWGVENWGWGMEARYRRDVGGFTKNAWRHRNNRGARMEDGR